MYHLKEILDLLSKKYFNDLEELEITWGKTQVGEARRCRKLGCFIPSEKRIRISRILDDKEIPDYFISFIVYHEVLHHLFPPKKGKRGRRLIHHKEFRAEEKKFKEYALVKEWEKQVGKKKFFLE